MSRYNRADYGVAVYGVDAAVIGSVQPMYATPTISVVDQSTGDAYESFMDESGSLVVRDRVEVSWMDPLNIQYKKLVRSNVGFPTSPSDPYSLEIPLDDAFNLPPVYGDPEGRQRVGLIDTGVIPGREYYYTFFTSDDGSLWDRAGLAITITYADHDQINHLVGSLPAYMTNSTAAALGVSTLQETDPDNVLYKWITANAWVLDGLLTRVDLLKNVWDANKTPLSLLPLAVRQFGLPLEPALGARAARALLHNAADLTGGRGTLETTKLLVECLSGMAPTATEGTKNLFSNVNEASFEEGPGRWSYGNSTVEVSTEWFSEVPNTFVARDRDAEEDRNHNTRASLRVVPGAGGFRLDLGRLAIDEVTCFDGYAQLHSPIPHGLEDGDRVITNNVTGVSNDDYEISVVNNHYFLVYGTGIAADNTSTLTNAFITSTAINVNHGVIVEPNTGYRFLAQVRTGTGSSTVTLSLSFFDKHGNLLDTQTRDNSITGTASEAYVTATSGSAAAYATCAIYSTSTAEHFLDNAMFCTAADYTASSDYEDPHLVTITLDPGTVEETEQEVIKLRMIAVLDKNLPPTTAFKIAYA